MKIIPQSAKQLIPTDGMEALKRIEYAGRTCYRSNDKITEGSAETFVRSQIKRGHHSPLEFADMAVEQITSRDVMAEITRHRLASICVESQRYVCMDGEISFIYPLCCAHDAEVDQLWRDSMRVAEFHYHTLLDIGCKPQDARKVLPNSTATKIVMKANMREWRHILALRTSKGVYPEMRDLMIKVLKIAKKQVPVIFDDIEVPQA